ncbi:MAG TPA: DUF1501 domain-containing protein [Planctomycetaceae bacterium]|nr:DUF1501 domain-containing protein [Planctomycetaceae bacterium]
MASTSGNSGFRANTVSRREFVLAGAFGGAVSSLASFLRAEEASGIRSSSKAVLFVHLDGGPPHLDMIDLKPDAPVEIRGDFQPIATRVPGVQVCELLPKLAGIANRITFVRSLVGSVGQHNAFQCQSGFGEKELQSLGGRPAMGAVVAKLQGSSADVAPAFVDLMQGRPLVRNSARPGFLGPAYQPFRPDISRMFTRELEPGMQNELAKLGTNHSVSLKLDEAVSLDRLNDRTELLAQFDLLRREVDAAGMMDAMDRFTQQAVGILTSGRFADALDLSREEPRVLDRFTLRETNGTPNRTSDGPESVRKFLLARRMIEAGVRCVSISISDFDTHTDNFPRLRHLLPIVDHGMHALITDLEEHGLLDDVTIVAWGEFGRTPRVDPKSGGRHHWPQVGPALLAGGGLRHGQVIGSTDRTASTVASRPVHYKDIFATVYHTLGIDPHRTALIDPQGRPQHLLDEGQPLRELV